jgi:hypothetical protein
MLRRLRKMSFGVATFRRARFEGVGGFDENVYGIEDLDMLKRLAASARRPSDRYRVLNDVLVLASARGFYRGGRLGMGKMLKTYAHMALSEEARRDISKCGYWYERD